MRNNFFFVIVLVLTISVSFFSCEKKKEILSEVPACIQAILEDDAQMENIKTIRMQPVNGIPQYWLNTDFMHFDGAEFIVDANCDTTCLLCGECFPPECMEDYNYEDWVIIWEK